MLKYLSSFFKFTIWTWKVACILIAQETDDSIFKLVNIRILNYGNAYNLKCMLRVLIINSYLQNLLSLLNFVMNSYNTSAAGEGTSRYFS